MNLQKFMFWSFLSLTIVEQKTWAMKGEEENETTSVRMTLPKSKEQELKTPSSAAQKGQVGEKEELANNSPPSQDTLPSKKKKKRKKRKGKSKE